MQWLDKLAVKTARPQQLVGVHLSLGREGVPEAFFVRLQKKKQQLLLLQKGVLSWEAFLQQHDSSLPLALSVDGKGILTKPVAAKQDFRLEEVLPNASEEDFYYNSLQSSHAGWVSLTRKPVLDELLQQAEAAGVSIAAVQLGPLSVAGVLPLLAAYPVLDLPQWHLQQQDTEIVGLQPQTDAANTVYTLGEEQLEGACLQAYANALSVLVELPLYADTNLAEVGMLWLHKRLYKRLGVGMLAFFFGLLLLNYAAFSYLSGSQQELQGQLQQQQHLLGQLQFLKKQEEARQQLLKAVPLQQQTLFAYHADLLGASVPAGVQLEELLVHPPEGKKSKQEALRFQHGLMEVRGQCNSPLLLNRWLEALEKEPWVKAVKNQRYGGSMAGQLGGAFGFTLEVLAP